MRRPYFLLFAAVLVASAAAQNPSAKPIARPAVAANAVPGGPIQTAVENYLRKLYAWGPAYRVKVGPPKDAPVADLLEVSIEVSLGDQTDFAVIYVTKDGRYLFRGELQDMTVDPLAAIRAKIQLGDSPTKGPANAPVTLVEYADFQCPTCRQLHNVLRQLEPQYPQVRIVYKDFPLNQIHPWAMTAALAGRCAFQQSPEGFWKIHDLIYDSQDVISPQNVWQKVIDFAGQTSLDLAAFRTCMASKETADAVTHSLEEGKALKIANTPTVFVNGRRLIGADRELLEQYIQFDIAARPLAPAVPH